ncbi:MAG: tRNA (guanosine(46)-N7)-methyltransferase TrmB [Bacilli bacterium]
MRLRNKPWAKDFLNEHPTIVIEDGKTYKGAWRERLGHTGQVHLEIGTGRGAFITELARRNPDVLYIGMEKYTSVIVDVLQKVLDLGLKNVVLLNEDATTLTDYFAPNEVNALFLNFSDPWPKDRHAKRRLTSDRFLVQYDEVVAPEGRLTFKTDNRLLFEYSLVSFAGYGAQLEEVQLNLHAVCGEENVETEYETKFKAKGPIYRAVVDVHAKR